MFLYTEHSDLLTSPFELSSLILDNNSSKVGFYFCISFYFFYLGEFTVCLACRIYGVHDEAKDKAFELELSWVCDESNRQHQKVDYMTQRSTWDSTFLKKIHDTVFHMKFLRFFYQNIRVSFAYADLTFGNA